jgi:hypothetical protein
MKYPMRWDGREVMGRYSVSSYYKPRKCAPDDDTKDKKRAAMTWAQCLKRAFKIDIEICE